MNPPGNFLDCADFIRKLSLKSTNKEQLIISSKWLLHFSLQLKYHFNYSLVSNAYKHFQQDIL